MTVVSLAAPHTGWRKAWLPLALAWTVLVVALSAWLGRTPVGVLREQLKVLQFWSLELCVVLGAALSVPWLRQLARSIRRRDAARMAILASTAMVLILFVAPRTNRIYYDEQIYQGIGQNMADLRLAQMCNDGTVEYGRLDCHAGEYNKQPFAFPHLLSLAYRAFGVHASTPFVINAVVAALAVCVIYVLVLLLFDDRRAAWFASLLLLLMPEQISWSASAAVEPSAALAGLVAVLGAAQFRRAPDLVSLMATGVASAYAAQFRPESLLILPVVVLLIWGERAWRHRPCFWWVALLTLGLLAVHIGHMWAVRGEGWGTPADRLSLSYVPANLRVNLGFYLADWRFPVLFTVLALAGMWGRARLVERAAVGSWFLIFLGVFALFYAGSYDYGADVRYSLMTYPPLAVFGGLGAARAVRWLNAHRPDLRPGVALTAALAFTFLWYAPLVRTTGEEAWAARADVSFSESMLPVLRGNTYVLTHNPSVFLVAGVNAGQMSAVQESPDRLHALASRYPGGVYLHWNFWCNVHDPLQRSYCDGALATARFDLVRERRVRDQRFAFYRLIDPSVAERR